MRAFAPNSRSSAFKPGPASPRSSGGSVLCAKTARRAMTRSASSSGSRPSYHSPAAIRLRALPLIVLCCASTRRALRELLGGCRQGFAQLRLGHRRSQEKALQLVAADRQRHVALLGRLDAFDRHLYLERAGEADHRLDDGVGIVVGAKLLDE